MHSKYRRRGVSTDEQENGTSLCPWVLEAERGGRDTRHQFIPIRSMVYDRVTG